MNLLLTLHFTIMSSRRSAAFICYIPDDGSAPTFRKVRGGKKLSPKQAREMMEKRQKKAAEEKQKEEDPELEPEEKK